MKVNRMEHVLAAVVGIGILGTSLLAQPDPGAGAECFKDKTPIPRACDVGGVMDDPNCTEGPTFVSNPFCSQVDRVLTGLEDSVPQGTVICAYNYWQFIDGECTLSGVISYAVNCSAAGGASCESGGGGGV